MKNQIRLPLSFVTHSLRKHWLSRACHEKPPQTFDLSRRQAPPFAEPLQERRVPGDRTGRTRLRLDLQPLRPVGLHRQLSSPPEWVEPFNDVSDIASPRNPTPSPWVGHILNLRRSADMELKLDDFCRKLLIKLSPNFVSFVLRSGQVKERPDVAVRFFGWAARQGRYKHRIECYVSLIELLSISGDLDGVTSVFAELRNSGFLMTVSAANSLIKSFGSVGMVEELLGVEEDEGEWYRAEFVYLQLFVEWFGGFHVYRVCGAGLSKVGKTQKAMEKLRDMETKSVEADKITYMTLIQACYGEGDFSSCLGLYREMEEKGLEIPPHAYSLVISGLSKEGKCTEAYAVYASMTRNGYRPNVAIYTSLIDSYAKCGSVEEAMRLFDRMRMMGFIQMRSRMGLSSTGCAKMGGWRRHLHTWSSEGREMDEAEKFFEEMAEKGCSRDSYCYNALMDAFTKCGKINEALALFRKMEDEGCDQTVYTFTILISGLFVKHQNEEALKLWDVMIDKGITPNAASIRALSTGLCLSGKVARACKILDELAPMGIIPDSAVEDMINVLCKAGRIKEACRLADGIVDRGREIPGKIRTILINALRKAGNTDLALKLMHSKIAIGYDRVGSVKKELNSGLLLIVES
ncbi:4-hydroxy-4-methyl-2-oxoglutarate aldolase (HMG aldolase) [Psidium guajava]|nr:4-hydroxy-4-methyl-2-oxoglutarate aldolase (HMG aldolase) [Psidium guajava]